MTWLLNKDGAYELRNKGILLGACWVRAKGRPSEFWQTAVYDHSKLYIVKCLGKAESKREAFKLVEENLKSR